MSGFKLISIEGQTYAWDSGIQVCFGTTQESHRDWKDVDTLNETARLAIEDNWGKKVGVVFKEWKDCRNSPDADVEIRFFDCVKDDLSDCPNQTRAPHVLHIGRVDGKRNIVHLRRTYVKHWKESDCNGGWRRWLPGMGNRILEARKRCTRMYAVHEFGHILGFDHEQYHPQGPEECEGTKYRVGAPGSFNVNGTARWLCSEGYDNRSVMNYCGVERLGGDSGLSPKDISCAKEFWRFQKERAR